MRLGQLDGMFGNPVTLLPELELWKIAELSKAVVSYLHKIMSVEDPSGLVNRVNAGG